MGALDSSAAPRPHAVLLPFPAQGHVRPLMQMAQRLTRVHGFKVTFANTSYIHKRLGLHDTTKVGDDLHFVDLQEGFPDDYYTATKLRDLFAGLCTLGPLLQEFLGKLQLKSPPITCVIADLTFLAAHRMATQLGLPSIGFFTQCAFLLSAKYYMPRLVEEGYLPLPGPPVLQGPRKVTRTVHEQLSPEDAAALARVVTCIPGLYPMRLGDFMTGFLVHDVSDPIFQIMAEMIENSQHQEWTLVNAFHELEAPVVEVLRQHAGINVTPIGPLVIAPTTRDGMFDVKEEESSSSSYWPEETQCIEWLDKQKPGSVVYVAFGSLAYMTRSVLEEFALGLEDSHVPFLLVVRLNLTDSSGAGSAPSLPPGFEERTKDRALIVSWAPQLKVLAHPATAGFFTHCGWNSVIESISMGVPMLGYPYFVDQPMNNRYSVSVWKTSLEFDDIGTDGFVARHEVAKKVRALAAPDAAVRVAARAWKDAAWTAVKAGGSSHRNMAAFVAAMYARAHAAASQPPTSGV